MSGEGWVGWNERIREARQSMPAKPSQKAFGDMLGEAQNTVSRWELGNGNPPTLEVFEKIAQVTGKPFLWLVSGHECVISDAEDTTDDLDRETVRRVVREMVRTAGPRIATMSPKQVADNVVDFASLYRGSSPETIRKLVEDYPRK